MSRAHARKQPAPSRDDDPVLRALREAASEPEPVSDDDREEIDEALGEVERGETLPHENVRRRLLGAP
jgi:DNA-directed RNA polymerase subunit K/omega